MDKDQGHRREDLKARHPLAVAAVLVTTLLLTACASGRGSGLEVGDPAPEFRLPSASGEKVALSEYRGSQPVLLYFHMADG